MSLATIVEISAYILQIILLFLVLINSYLFIGKSNRRLVVIYFSLAITSMFLDTLYWIAYELIRPDTRMPFAVDEMGETAMYLLLGVCFSLCVPARLRLTRETIGAAVFVVINIVLWILWSGEWVQDIFGGLSYGYLMIVVSSRLEDWEGWKTKDKLIHGICVLAVLLLQVSNFFSGTELKNLTEIVASTLLLLIILYSMFRTVISLRSPIPESSPADIYTDTSGYCVCPAYVSFLWAVTAMYMTTGIFYSINVFLESAITILILLAIRKEVSQKQEVLQHDLR